MLFNSFQFLVFFAGVLVLYWVLPHRWQNRFLLAASLWFYGAWDWRFLFLLIFSSGIDYVCGLRIEAAGDNRSLGKRWLALSVGCHIVILGFFKYFNFFTGNLVTLFRTAGIELDAPVLHIILPVGISFYTFQTMSYTIDVWRKRIRAERHLPDFMLFVSFFPQLVAGPIERAGHLLPQIKAPRTLTPSQWKDGAWLILWGLYKKVFVADNLARIVTAVFDGPGPFGSAQIVLAAYAFVFQVYADFAGYSDMARGLGKWLGFEMSVNFNIPYFAPNPAEFTRRWHMTLSSWIRDYIYEPLKARNAALALMIAMTLFGFWHGARWTYVVYGVVWGLILLGYRVTRGWVKFIPSSVPVRILSAFLTFNAMALPALIFRSSSLMRAKELLTGLSSPLWLGTEGLVSILAMLIGFIQLVGFMLIVQLYKYRQNDLLAVTRLPLIMRSGVYIIVLYSILLYGYSEAQNFIYFQF